MLQQKNIIVPISLPSCCVSFKTVKYILLSFFRFVLKEFIDLNDKSGLNHLRKYFQAFWACSISFLLPSSSVPSFVRLWLVLKRTTEIIEKCLKKEAEWNGKNEKILMDFNLLESQVLQCRKAFFFFFLMF